MEFHKDSLPSYMTKLIKLLARPRHLKIAENMIKSWLNNDKARFSVELVQCERTAPAVTLCNSCALHHQLNEGPFLCCYEFHWSCVLRYLSDIKLAMNKDDCTLKSCPLFFSLPIVAQHNFLLLVKEFLPVIPKAQLHEFISLVERNANDSDCWMNYLVRTLKCSMIVRSNNVRNGSDTNGNFSHHCVPFTQDTLDRIRGSFNISYDSNVMPVLPWSSEQRINPLKRPREVDDDVTQEPSKPVKIQMIDVSSQEDEEGILVQAKHEEKLMDVMSCGSGSLSQQQTTNVSASPLEVELEQSAVHQDQLDIKITSIVNNYWKTELLCEQTDFDELASSSKFSNLVLIAAGQTYTDNGLTAIIKNILNSSVDISCAHLTCYFKDLLVDKVVCFERAFSRSLVTSIVSLCRKYSFVFVDGFLFPLILHKKFASVQCTLVCKVVKSALSEDHRTHLWTIIIIQWRRDSAFIWNDNILQCLSALIEQGIKCDSGHQEVIHALDRNAIHSTGNLLFTKLFILLLSKHGNKFTGFKDSLLKIASENKTGLKPKLLKLLE